MIERHQDMVAPCCRLVRVGDVLVASDLGRHQFSPDFVMGPGPSSFLLARHVRPAVRGRLLDLGCGPAFQGLVHGGTRTEVHGVDISERAIAFARFNARLNGRDRLRAELGDFLGEVPDRRLDGRFDTVVANPPYVIAPERALIYRDSPLGGDDVGARTVERVARALAPGGRGYVLCNWIDRGGAWSDPVRRWLADTGATSVVTRLRELSAADYVAIWTRGIPVAERPRAVSEWVAAFERDGIRRIHVGVVALARLRGPRRSAFRAVEGSGGAGAWRTLEAALTGV